MEEAGARALLRASARQHGLLAAAREESSRFAFLLATIASRPASVLHERAREGAAAFGDPDAAAPMFEILSALREGIRIIDDIENEEADGMAAEIGAARALKLASGAFAFALAAGAAR